MTPRVSIVIPVFNEGESIVTCLGRVLDAVTVPCEVLVVYDFPEDTTVPYAEKCAANDDRVRPVLNDYGRGPAHAIRYGIDSALAPVVVVTMADGSDDPRQIDELTWLVERGVVPINHWHLGPRPSDQLPPPLPGCVGVGRKP